jgi:hypothetical protein
MFLEIQPRASGVSQRSKALHRSAGDPGSILGCVAADRETHETAHYWPHVVRGGFGQLGCPYPITLRSSNSLWRPGACTLTSGRQLYGVSSDTGAAGFRVKRAVCQEAVRVVFQRTHGSRPSPLYRRCSDGTRL